MAKPPPHIAELLDRSVESCFVEDAHSAPTLLPHPHQVETAGFRELAS